MLMLKSTVIAIHPWKSGLLTWFESLPTLVCGCPCSSRCSSVSVQCAEHFFCTRRVFDELIGHQVILKVCFLLMRLAGSCAPGY